EIEYKETIQKLQGSGTYTNGISEKLSSRISEIEKEQEDLLVCLAEQDLEVKRLKERLKSYGEVFETDEDEDEESEG
ncbi:hypothetical protein HDU92_000437, partial [Lobulomyces angularis]